MTTYYVNNNFSSTDDLNNKYYLTFPEFLKNLEKEYPLNNSFEDFDNLQFSVQQDFIHSIRKNITTEIGKWKKYRKQFLIDQYSPSTPHDNYDNYLNTKPNIEKHIEDKINNDISLETKSSDLFIFNLQDKYNSHREHLKVEKENQRLEELRLKREAEEKRVYQLNIAAEKAIQKQIEEIRIKELERFNLEAIRNAQNEIKSKYNENLDLGTLREVQSNLNRKLRTSQNLFTNSSGSSGFSSEYNYDEDELENEKYGIEKLSEYLQTHKEEPKKVNKDVTNLLDSFLMDDFVNAANFNSTMNLENYIPNSNQANQTIELVTQSFLDKKVESPQLDIISDISKDFNKDNLQYLIKHNFSLFSHYLKTLQNKISKNDNYEPSKDSHFISLQQNFIYSHFLIKSTYSNKIHNLHIYKDAAEPSSISSTVTENHFKIAAFYFERTLEIFEKISQNPQQFLENKNLVLAILGINKYVNDQLSYHQNNNNAHSDLTLELHLVQSLPEKEQAIKNIELANLKNQVQSELTPILHKEIEAKLTEKFNSKVEETVQEVTRELESQTRDKFDKLVMNHFLKIPSVVMDILPLQSRSFTVENIVNVLNGKQVAQKEEPFNFDIDYPQIPKKNNKHSQDRDDSSEKLLKMLHTQELMEKKSNINLKENNRIADDTLFDDSLSDSIEMKQTFTKNMKRKSSKF